MSKTIVITGGGRGIGRATAVLCAQRGWSVALQYRGNRAAAEETVGLIEQAGGHALAVQGDVSSDEDVIALFEAAAGPQACGARHVGPAAVARAFAGSGSSARWAHHTFTVGERTTW